MTGQPTADERPVPPPLDWQPPLCPVCGNTVVHLGYSPAAGVTTWGCADCHAKWRVEHGDDETAGEWMDPDEPQCRSEARTKAVRTLTLVEARCVLGENHVDAEDWQAREHKGVSTSGKRLVWGRNTWVEETVPAAPKDERDARTAERWRRLRAEAREGTSS